MDSIYDSVDVEAPADGQPVTAAYFLHKGGVGKTTSCGMGGVACARLGLDTVLVDLAGLQSDLAKQFGLYDHWMHQVERGRDDTSADPDWPNISTVFSDQWDQIAKLQDDVVDQLVYPTGEGPDLIPSHPGLDGVDDDLGSVNVEDRYGIFEGFVEDHLAPRYDVILIDLPGSITSNITWNGLQAAESVITPMKLDMFEDTQLDSLISELVAFNDAHGRAISLDQIIPTMVDGRKNVDEDILSRLDADLQEFVAPEPVSATADVSNSKSQPTAVADVLAAVNYDRPRADHVRSVDELVAALEDGVVEGPTLEAFVDYVDRGVGDVAVETVADVVAAVEAEPDVASTSALDRLFYAPTAPETHVGTIWNMPADERLRTGQRVADAYLENMLAYLETAGLTVRREASADA